MGVMRGADERMMITVHATSADGNDFSGEAPRIGP